MVATTTSPDYQDFLSGSTPQNTEKSNMESENKPSTSGEAYYAFSPAEDIPNIFPMIREVKEMPQIHEPGLRAKVLFMDNIGSFDEEVLVRSLHPSLKDCRSVSVVEDGQVMKPLWLVNPKDAKNIKHTHAAGREIHILPEHSTRPVSLRGLPVRFTDISSINPRHFLPSEHIDSIRHAFSGSIGAQLLLSGWLLVVFPNKKALEACWKTDAPSEVGGLRVGFIPASYNGTAEIFEFGRTISEKPEDLGHQAAVGLRLRLPGGLEAITTVTHAFVCLANARMSNIRKRIMEHILTAKDYLKRMRPPPSQAPSAGIVHSRRVANSPLNKKVWMSGTDTCIGTVRVTYDRCKRHHLIPYPHGFQHDLCLVTGPDLPQLTNPPNTPVVTEWGPYEEALEGRPVFINSYNLITGNLHTRQGHGVMTQAQQSIVHGTQYSWDEKARAQGTALLWRTIRDTDGVEGASGSVLCLGNPQDRTARALLFQNFQGRLMANENVKIGDNEDRPTFKGGFLLPSEIRNSQIVTAKSAQPEKFLTPQKSKNGLGVPERYNMTV